MVEICSNVPSMSVRFLLSSRLVQTSVMPSDFTQSISRSATLWAVQEPGQHLALPVPDIIAASGAQARPGPTVAAALNRIAAAESRPARILICGSLYLAGEVLKADNPPRL